MLLTISQVIWQFRQDHAVSKLFHCDFDFDFNFNFSSSRTSFHSLKMLIIINVFCLYLGKSELKKKPSVEHDTYGQDYGGNPCKYSRNGTPCKKPCDGYECRPEGGATCCGSRCRKYSELNNGKCDKRSLAWK